MQNEHEMDANEDSIEESGDMGQESGDEPLFRIKAVAPYVNEPVVQQNCIR